jgi:hypothetical protein
MSPLSPISPMSPMSPCSKKPTRESGYLSPRQSTLPVGQVPRFIAPLGWSEANTPNWPTVSGTGFLPLVRVGTVGTLVSDVSNVSDGTLGTCKCVRTGFLPLVRAVTAGTAVSLGIAGVSRSKNWDIWDTYFCWDRTGVVCMVCDSCDTYLAGSLIVHYLGDAGSGDRSGSVAYFLPAGNG